MNSAIIDLVYSSFGENGLEYINNINNSTLFYNIDLDLPVDDDFNSIINKLVKSHKWFAFYRKALIKKLFTKKLKDDYLIDCLINFPFKCENNAYMLDSGKAYFSFKWIYGESGDNLAKTVLHEFSHLILSKCDNYSKLKEINKKFHLIYGKDDRIYVLSPIEYLATSLCIKFLTANMDMCADEKVKAKYQKQIDKETLKISNSIEFLIKKYF